MTEEALLRFVASAERSSEHPLGAAIVSGAEDRGIELVAPTEFDSITGQGLRARVDGHDVRVGNRRLLDGAGIDPSDLEPHADRLSAAGKTPMFVAVDGVPAGVIAVADTLKDDSVAAIAALRALGIDVVMITGDNRRTAGAIARTVGIKRVLAEVLPEHKADEVRRLQAEGRSVGMVGDGINDAPALAVSSLSVVTNANRLRRFHPLPLPESATARTVEPRVEVGAGRNAVAGLETPSTASVGL